MKGLVKVTPESMSQILSDIRAVIENFNKDAYAKKIMIWSWRKFKKVECTHYSGMPFWYQYKDSLFYHLKDLENMAIHSLKTGDEIWISELSYCHLLRLASGDKYANPIYIMDY